MKFTHILYLAFGLAIAFGYGTVIVARANAVLITHGYTLPHVITPTFQVSSWHTHQHKCCG